MTYFYRQHFVLLGLVLSMGVARAADIPVNADLGLEIRQLRKDLETMRGIYEERIRILEDRLAHLEKPPPEQPAPKDELANLLAEAEEAAAEPSSAPLEYRLESSPVSRARNLLNPRITAFGDILGRVDDAAVRNEAGAEVGDRISLREVELDFREDIDPYAKGILILSVEEEAPNDYNATIEESYVTFPNLPFNLKGKIGRFRTGFGQINKLHLHDLPQFDYPLPVRTFFGEEGDIENGLSLSYLLPPLGKNIFELEFQFLNGENKPLLAGPESNGPAFLSHLKFFRDIGENRFLEIGASNLFGYNDTGKEFSTHLSGLDFLYKWRPLERGEYRSFVMQGELFYLNKNRPDRDISSFGAYLYAQSQIGKRTYLGVRGDWTEFPDDTEGDAWSITPYISFYTTEFLRFRLGYEHLKNETESLDSLKFQVTFVFGSHPAEPYWFNK